MDTEIPKKAKTGSKRHSTPSSLIRRISKRLSAPVRSQNKDAFRQNEHAYSGETSQTTSLNELRGITKGASIRSFMNSSKPSRPSSAASSSMQSRSDTMPTRPTSTVETSTSGCTRISGPVVSTTTASSMLQKYSNNQIVYVGEREDRAKVSAGEQAAPFKSDLPASVQNSTSPTSTAVPSEIFSEPPEHLLPELKSSSEYIGPRSQWKLSNSDLLTNEQQMPVKEELISKAVSHEHQASINELRQYLRDSVRSSTSTNSTETSTPRTSLSEELESSADSKYSGPVFEEPCCTSVTGADTTLTDGILFEKPECILDTDPLSNCSAEPTGAEEKITDSPIFKEPSCNTDTNTLCDYSTASSGESCNSHLSKTSIPCTSSKNMFSNTKHIDNAQETEEDKETPREEPAFTHAVPLSLSNPLFRQSLQPSPEEEEAEKEEEEEKDQPNHPSSPPQKTPQPPKTHPSKPHPLIDNLLLTTLSNPQDKGPSGDEMRYKRTLLVTKILTRNPQKWAGSGVDILDVRIAENKRLKEKFDKMRRGEERSRG